MKNHGPCPPRCSLVGKTGIEIIITQVAKWCCTGNMGSGRREQLMGKREGKRHLNCIFSKSELGVGQSERREKADSRQREQEFQRHEGAQ